MARVNPYNLLFRLSVATGIPAALPASWVQRNDEKAKLLESRGLAAYWNRALESYAVEPNGDGPRKTLALGVYEAYQVCEIGIHPEGESSFRPVFHGFAPRALAERVEGFLEGIHAFGYAIEDRAIRRGATMIEIMGTRADQAAKKGCGMGTSYWKEDAARATAYGLAAAALRAGEWRAQPAKAGEP